MQNMQNYTFMEKLGKGTHGTVYLMKSHEEDRFVVCKSVTGKHKSHAYREISILSRLNHRRVVSLLNSLVLKDTVCLMLEYINHGSVESLVEFFTRYGKRPAPTLGWNFLAQVSDALYYLHSKRIIHRDVKPSNILVGRFFVGGKEYLEFKLCDFSLSTRCNGSIEDGHIVGTPFYMAPEVIRRHGYDYTVDVWGLGCCLYELMNLQKPFPGDNRRELFKNILNERPQDAISWGDASLELLGQMCLEKTDRVSSKAIARHERVKLHLAMLEVRIKESRIEELERRLKILDK